MSCVMQPSVRKSHTMLNREYDQVCSIARTLEVLGERWTLLVIRDVFNGRRRFDQIQENLGVARNVLSTRLARLVDEGILEKRAYQERPPRYEYFLTEKGLDLWPVMISMLALGRPPPRRAERPADADPPQGLRRARRRARLLRAAAASASPRATPTPSTAPARRPSGAAPRPRQL